MIYSHHGVWIPGSKTLTLMDPKTYEARHYQHEHVDGKKLKFSEVEIIDDDRAFVATSRGVFLLQISSGTFTKIDSNYNKSIQDLFLDSRGNLWISTIHAGLRVIENAAKLEAGSLTSRMISEGITRQAIQVNAGEIWVQKYMKGIQIVDLDTLSPRQHLRRDRIINHSLNSDSISKMIVSKQGLIIVGLWGGGIQFYDSQLNYINPFLIKGEGLDVNEGISIGKIQYSPISGLWLFGKSQFINLDSSNKFQSKQWPELKNLIGKEQWPESAVLTQNETKEEMLYALSNKGRLVEFHLEKTQATGSIMENS